LTVKLYRLGLLLMTSGLLAMSMVQAMMLYSGEPATGQVDTLLDAGPMVLICMGMGLSVASMHLYDKRIRWIIRTVSWLGVVLLLTSATLGAEFEHFVHSLGLGFVFVSASAFALKEQFCFQLKALRLVPVFLGISAFALWLEVVVLSAPLLGLTGLIYARLALAKATMPLHFDIGDKSKYQV
jgi:uncharacterized integral membrane protein